MKLIDSQGWICLHRKIRNHPFYRERRVFSRYEAWIDLLLLANHETHEFPFEVKGGRVEMIQVSPGEIITSEVKLMEHWRWSKSKVRWFLNVLEKDRAIDRIADSKKTRIVLLNWGTYQISQNTDKPSSKPSNIPQKDTNKNKYVVKEGPLKKSMGVAGDNGKVRCDRIGKPPEWMVDSRYCLYTCRERLACTEPGKKV